MKRIVLAFALFAIPTIAAAGDIYKCTSKDGKVEYGAQPCEVGKAETGKIQTVPMSPGEQSNANASVNNYRSELARRESVDRAAETDQAQARARAAQNATVQRDVQESAKRQQQLENEKQLVHTDTGWERLTRAQIAAREKRLEAEAKAATARANTAATQANAVPGQANINNTQQQVLLNGVPMVPTGGGYIAPQTGTFYIDAGGGIINSQTGQFIPK